MYQRDLKWLSPEKILRNIQGLELLNVADVFLNFYKSVYIYIYIYIIQEFIYI